MAGKWIRTGGAVATSLALAMVAVPASADDAVDRQAIDRYVSEYAARAGYPGVSVAVTKGGRSAIAVDEGVAHVAVGQKQQIGLAKAQVEMRRQRRVDVKRQSDIGIHVHAFH